MNNPNETIHPLRKGDDVFTAVVKPFRMNGYAHDSHIEVMHGVVSGGGEAVAIIDWDAHREARYLRHRSPAITFDMTREAALRRLEATVRRAEDDADQQIVIGHRLRASIVALLETK